MPPHAQPLAPPEADAADADSVLARLNAQFPLAGPTVDGRTVRSHVPNTGSIGASLNEAKALPGVREVPFSAFTQMGEITYSTVSDERRTHALVEQIQASEELNPLIVVIDDQGPYILEGGHRFDALREMNATAFPALVVLDLEALGLDEDFDVGPRPSPPSAPLAVVGKPIPMVSVAPKVDVPTVSGQPLLSDTIGLPFEEGLPTPEKVVAIRQWLTRHSDRYKNESTVLFHATGVYIPIAEEGLKPTTAARRRSHQSTSGFVYLANTPERAEAFGNLGNQGQCRVYAVRVRVRHLKADTDQLNNLRSVGRDVGNSLAESIVHGGGARFKGAISPWDVREVKRNDSGVFVAASAPVIHGADASAVERARRAAVAVAVAEAQEGALQGDPSVQPAKKTLKTAGPR